jgi:crotonobetainyl-CoA:carnitine CoA-transferase CaiB-like acyl-CoA transferase
VAVADVVTGLYAAIAILACLRAREQSGHGYAIDMALLDCAVACQVNVVQAFLTSGKVPDRQGNAHLQIVPYQLFATADGWLVLAVGNDGQWQRFCQAAERHDLAEDPRFASNTLRVQNRATLVPLVEAVMKSHPNQVWEQRLNQAEVPHGPVWNYADLFQHPQGEARGLKVVVRDSQGREVELAGSPFHIRGSELPTATVPPLLGQHTEQILRETLGLDPLEIARLRSAKVI